jgi:hypothetical protein
LNVSDPTNPTVAGSYNTPGLANGLWVKDEYVYVADSYSFMILETSYGSEVREISDGQTRPSDFVLLQNYPNPFNPATNIEFVLSKSGQVKIEIFNILGQRIRTLVDEHLKPGHKVVDWDGRDDSGEEVSSGIYFYRLQTEDFTDAKKMLLLK